jgi:hypothetical protein
MTSGTLHQKPTTRSELLALLAVLIERAREEQGRRWTPDLSAFDRVERLLAGDVDPYRELDRIGAAVAALEDAL